MYRKITTTRPLLKGILPANRADVTASVNCLSVFGNIGKRTTVSAMKFWACTGTCNKSEKI
jgi:hypothetical protein